MELINSEKEQTFPELRVKMWLTAKGQKWNLGDDRNILFLDCGGDTWAYMFVKTNWAVHFKYTHLIVGKLSSKKLIL